LLLILALLVLYLESQPLYLDSTFYVRIYPGDKAILRMKELLEWIE
jgi:hypothetical protein